MLEFHVRQKNHSVGYRAFKYLVVGAATLMLTPKRFYDLRDWYWHKQMGRVRELLFKDRAER
jgi:hypothetical protein